MQLPTLTSARGARRVSTVCAALALALLPATGQSQNVMNLLNIQAFYQYVVRGLILLVAVLLDNLRSSAAGRRH